MPLESVKAAFLYVRSGEVIHPDELPDRAALERLLTQDPADPQQASAGDPPDEHASVGG